MDLRKPDRPQEFSGHAGSGAESTGRKDRRGAAQDDDVPEEEQRSRGRLRQNEPRMNTNAHEFLIRVHACSVVAKKEVVCGFSLLTRHYATARRAKRSASLLTISF